MLRLPSALVLGCFLLSPALALGQQVVAARAVAFTGQRAQGAIAIPSALPSGEELESLILAAEVHVPESPSDTAMPMPGGEKQTPSCGACDSDAPCGQCNCCECQKKAAALKAAIAGAYKPLFYDNNFAYINNPNYDLWYPGDAFKQLHWGECWTVDIGGQYRFRYMAEENMRGVPGNPFGVTGGDDNFLLHRTRLFLNAKYGDSFRFYGEYIDAESNYENLPPRGIEVNRSDMLNLFVDAKLLSGDRGDLWLRVGRQELLYGAERLVSPLDWANTRRTFDGAKLFYQGEDWNVDLFATKPVLPNPKHFDSPVEEQDFFGMWATNKAVKGETLDLFAIQYNNELGTNDFQFTTLGGRYLRNHDDELLWETEGGVQFGDNTDGSGHGAAFFTQGIGRRNVCHAWKPQLWLYYDFASGGDAGDLGEGNGFNHLFPLAHKYLGFMDLFGRSNIESVNCQFTCQPHPRLKLLAWYYYLWLQTANDTPYSVVMTPYNAGNAPASRDLGHELDLTATWLVNDRMDLVFGYSHFWRGNYYQLTPGAVNLDADFFYLQGQWHF